MRSQVFKLQLKLEAALYHREESNDEQIQTINK